MNLFNDRYKVLASINEDSSNSLFLVSDLSNKNKKIAFKIINPELITSRVIDYLKKDFITLSTLSHPNLMEMYSFGTLNTVDKNPISSLQYYCSYEYIKGKNISNYTQGMGFDKIMELVVEICKALNYLHRRGFTYRTLEAKNILVTENDNIPCVKLLGITGNEDVEKTIFKLKRIAPQYRAPEFLKYEDATHLSDIYSLGVLIFCLITRKKLSSNSFQNVWSKFKASNQIANILPDGIDTNTFISFIDKMTSTKPQERYQEIDSIIEALNVICNKNFCFYELKPYQKLITKTRLIGRVENLKQLCSWKDEVLNNGYKKRIAFISGDTGIGKTRLLKELSHLAGLEGIKVLYGICSEEEGNPYEPVLDILTKVIPLSSSENLDKYKSELIKVLPDEKTLKDAVPSPALPDDNEKLRLKIRMTSFILNTLEKQPTIIIFDNAQWMNESSYEFIDYLVNQNKKAPIWIILSARKDELDKNTTRCQFIRKWIKTGIANEMCLSRLDFEETGELIRNLLGMRYSPAAFSTEIFHYTEGNPGFITDSITALYSEGKLFIDDKGNWSTDFDDDADYSMLYIPLSIHEAVWKHINTLPPSCHELLELLSTCNMPVPFEVIDKVTCLEEEQLKLSLHQLISHQILDQRLSDWGYTYDFHSRSIKSEIYKNIPDKQKKEYHIQLANILERIYRKEDRINQDELIHHFVRGGEKSKALELIIVSSEKMLKLHINTQALAYLRIGRQLAKDISSVKDTIKVLLMMGELHRRKGENEKAFECYHEVLKCAVNSNDKLTIAKVKEMIGALYTRRSDFNKALILLNDSLKISKEISYIEGYLEAVRRICWVYIFKRKNSEAIEMIHRVLNEYGEEKYFYYHAQLYNVLGTHYLELSNVQEALNSYNKSIELFEKTGEKADIAYPLNNIATVFAEFLQDHVKAREYFKRSLEINISCNLVEGIASCYDNLGETCRLEDNYAEALEYYYKCEEQAAESELNSLLFTVYKNMLLAYLELDEYQKSHEYLQKATSEMVKNPDRGLDLQIFYEYSSRFYYETGNFEKAKSYASLAIEACKKSGVQESIYSRSMVLLSDFAEGGPEPAYTNPFLLGSMDEILQNYQNSNAVKEKREVLHRFAQVLIDLKEPQEALRLIEESRLLSFRLNTCNLEIDFLLLSGTCLGGQEGIKAIHAALEQNEKVKCLRYYWKGYKALGDIYDSLNDKHLSATYYVKALDVLYRLVQKVPAEYQKFFLYSHNRFRVREKLLIMKADNLKEQKQAIEKQISKRINKNENLIHFFFGIISHDTINTTNKYSFSAGSHEPHLSFNQDSLLKIKDVLENNTKDYFKNMKQIINTACDLTSATTAYILRYNEKNDLYVFLSSSNRIESHYYEYVIENSVDNNEGFFITDTYGKKAGSPDIVLPSDIRGIICLPIISYEIEDKNPSNRRKTNANIKGYIYLATNTLLNNFTAESFELCKILAHQACLQMDNYDLKIISSIDKLTGVYTRKYFESIIHIQLMKAHKDKLPLSVIMIDIDKFKSINDNFGHQKGDEILKSIGKILIDNVRSTDICCRYGGEEFIILLPEADISEAEALAERLRKTVEKARLMGQHTNLTISLGLSSYPKHGEWRDELIGKADQALYHAKESGRNRYFVWNTKLRKLAKRMDKLAGIISGNLVKDQRNVLAILEFLNYGNENGSFSEKVFKILGTIIETFECETAMLLTVSDQTGKLCKVYTRKKYLNDWSKEECYNKKIFDKVLKTFSGTYLVDWDNVAGMLPETGEPIVYSILAVPLIKDKIVKGVLYLSSPMSQKEYGFNELNFLNTISSLISTIFQNTEYEPALE